MVNFSFDADVRPSFRFLLEERGHAVVTAQELGMSSAQDAEVLVVATELDRVVITHNGKDFRTLCQAWPLWRRRWGLPPAKHAGVVAIPQQTLLPYPAAADEIDQSLPRHLPVWNELWFFDLRSGDWVRQV